MNRAARISAAAGTGQVLASLDVVNDALHNTSVRRMYTATRCGLVRV